MLKQFWQREFYLNEIRQIDGDSMRRFILSSLHMDSVFYRSLADSGKYTVGVWHSAINLKNTLKQNMASDEFMTQSLVVERMEDITKRKASINKWFYFFSILSSVAFLISYIREKIKGKDERNIQNESKPLATAQHVKPKPKKK